MWVGLIEFCVNSREFSTLPLKNIYLAGIRACPVVGLVACGVVLLRVNKHQLSVQSQELWLSNKVRALKSRTN